MIDDATHYHRKTKNNPQTLQIYFKANLSNFYNWSSVGNIAPAIQCWLAPVHIAVLEIDIQGKITEGENYIIDLT